MTLNSRPYHINVLPYVSSFQYPVKWKRQGHIKRVTLTKRKKNEFQLTCITFRPFRILVHSRHLKHLIIKSLQVGGTSTTAVQLLGASQRKRITSVGNLSNVGQFSKQASQLHSNLYKSNNFA